MAFLNYLRFIQSLIFGFSPLSLLGIWDCLTSQQVVDIIRMQVAQRKELSEIAEYICDHCLAPDTTSGAGIGCDNMTIMIVALLGGRTKEEWYDWIADRYNTGYGYQTPSEVPQLYAPHRINAFRVRRRAYEERIARERASGTSEDPPVHDRDGGFGGVFGGRGLTGPTTALDIARAMLNSGLSFHTGPNMMPDDGTIMFTNEEDSEDESEDEIDLNAVSAKSFLTALGLRAPGPDVTKSLKAQLDELEENDTGSREQASDEETETETEIMYTDPGDEAQQAFGANAINGIASNNVREAPPSPAPLANGDSKVKQLSSLPGGDESPSVVKAEGLMDVSESPLSG